MNTLFSACFATCALGLLAVTVRDEAIKPGWEIAMNGILSLVMMALAAKCMKDAIVEAVQKKGDK